MVLHYYRLLATIKPCSARLEHGLIIPGGSNKNGLIVARRLYCITTTVSQVDFTGHVSLKTTAEEIERTLRVKLRERTEGRSCHELHRIWTQYDKDFDHRVDINEFKQILVSFNIHPSDDLLRSLFRRYDTNDDGLIERAEFENAILNGILPRGGRAQTSQGFHRAGQNVSNRSVTDNLLSEERAKLEQHARVTMSLLQEAKAANRRVLKLQSSPFSRRSGSRGGSRAGSRAGSRPGTVPALVSDLGLTGTRVAPLDLSKAHGL